MIKRWTIRHRRTNVQVGVADLDIPVDRLEQARGPTPYFFAIWPPLEDFWKVMNIGEQEAVGGPDLFARKATVWMDTRTPEGWTTLWVDKASELVGLSSFESCL